MAEKRMTIQVNPKMDSILEELSESESMTKTQVIRRAVALYRFLEEERRQGNRVTISDKEGKVIKEVVSE